MTLQNTKNRISALSLAPVPLGTRLTDGTDFGEYLANESAPILPARRSVENRMVGDGKPFRRKGKAYYWMPSDFGWDGLLNDQISAILFRRWLGGAVTPVAANGVNNNTILQEYLNPVPLCSNGIFYNPSGGERFRRGDLAVNTWEISQESENMPTARFGFINSGDWRLISAGYSIVAAATASAAATSITVDPIPVDIPIGGTVVFGGVTATLTAKALAGATTLAVAALSGEIADNTVGVHGGNTVDIDPDDFVAVPEYNFFHGAKTNLTFSDGVTTFNLNAEEGRLINLALSGSNNILVRGLPGDLPQNAAQETYGFVAGTMLIQDITAGLRAKLFMDGDLKHFHTFMRDVKVTSVTATFKSDNIIGTSTDRCEFEIKYPIAELAEVPGDVEGTIGAMNIAMNAVEGSASTGCLVEGRIKRVASMATV